MAEMKSLTLNDTKYDSFVDTTARKDIDGLKQAGVGKPGADGFSPVATVTQTDSGAVISITDKNGTSTATVTNGKDGVNGEKGEQGETGTQGPPGTDGYTPVRGDDYWTPEDVSWMESFMSGLVEDAYEKGTSISSDEDLDDYRTIGKYYANSNSIAASLKNCPTTQNFVMWVFVRTNSAPSQIIIDLTGKMFIRSRSSTKFNNWQTYLTDKNVATLLTDIVVEELAKYGQLKPEFANTVAECTDSKKLYVLPDGYIYAYMENANVPLFKNQLENAVDTSGAKYNGGKGYKEGFRFNSSKQEVEADGQLITGYIPYTPGQVIRVSGYTSSDKPSGYMQICNGSHSVVQHQQAQQMYGTYQGYAYGEDPTAPGVYMLTIDPSASGDLYFIPALNTSDAQYIRFNIDGYNLSALKVTLDEEIAYGTSSGWQNTGHAFVPADYEDRIIELEETTEANTAELKTQKQQIAALQNGGSVIPNYVISEAESVIDRVSAVQGNRTFTFGAISDMHYGVWSYTDGIEHACQALKYIDERIKLDAVAVLGDYTDNWVDSVTDEDIGDFKVVNSILDDLRFAPNLRLAGNHDIYNENPALTMRYINAYSDDVVWGSIADGYYYRDFDGYKIRVIGVNTSMVTANQYNWFVSALDLSNKDDMSDWSVLVISHHPLDWWELPDYAFSYILDAYKNGTSGEIGEISYDFTNGKNAAKLIGNIHGHIHNFKVDYIYLGDTSKGNKSSVLRMATPNSCYNRENEYEGVWADETAYHKTKDSAKDTSFCIYCIDLDACTIKAICYGAGYDREADYSYTNDVTPPAKPVMDTETWTFELEDGTTITKQVVVMV